jgi:glycosyltransferase involved in cell wall biosynthesis
VVEVAQITPWKGQDTAIRMLAGIRRRMPDTHLLLVGSVAFRTKLTRYDNTAFLAGLHELVDDLGLSGHVHFLGHRDDVPAILADADLTVLPSWDEPFGTAAVESMATGTPALVGRIGGVAELVEDGVSGHRLPPRDPDAWARVALELLEHPERLAAMGEAAQARARRFTDEAYAAAMEEAYLRARARCGDGARGGGGGG